MYSYKSKLYIYILLLSILIVVYGTTVISTIVGFILNELYFDKINVIAAASGLLFVILSALSLTSSRIYFTLLVFQIIAFPSAVDNFIPGVYFGSKSELHASITPLFTHIDIFILLGIIRGVLSKNRLILIDSNLLLVSVLVLFLSSIVNAFYSTDAQDFFLIVSGFMHLRYLIGLYILFSLYDPHAFTKQFILGLIISVVFLFCEAIVFTNLNNLDRLTSGSLGNNTFGNIIACLTVFFYFISIKTKSIVFRLLLVVVILIGVVTVIFSQTRMALLAGFVLFCVVTFYLNRSAFRTILYLTVFFIVLGISFIYLDAFSSNLGQRFDIIKVFSKIELNFPGSGRDIIEMELTPETASILTRLQLYKTSFSMITANPFFGIGSMRWDYYKAEYGFNEKVLLDTHNGYLAIISQFGIFSIIFLYFIYLRPLVILRRIRFLDETGFYLILISIGMAICDLTNAGIYKHQVFGLLCLSTIVLIHLSYRNKFVQTV
ncbi:MAG: O-antigen ligase family protein [Cyclobacteriaceae bacterium]|nr:O-antigen ligase family protein [Cyclobacteriaceae bacterium]